MLLHALGLVALSLGAIASPIPRDDYDVVASSLRDSYIVILEDGISVDELDTHYSRVDHLHVRTLDKRSYPGIQRKYNIGSFHGYAGQFDSELIEAIRADPKVKSVQIDRELHLLSTRPARAAEGDEVGLAALSSREPNATKYIYDESAGEGTYAYVIDSGVRLSHEEFEGRAVLGFDGWDTGGGDELGHGTHVAGTIGGKRYGVAKKTSIVDVKVYYSFFGSDSITLAGIDWAANDIVEKGRQSRAVMNLSLGRAGLTVYNDAINSAYDMGVLSVIAAGNSDGDSTETNFGPCNAERAFCVGSIDREWNKSDFSNYGSVVKLFATGSNVTSAYATGDTDYAMLDGTSMACPHVAGLALYLQRLEDLKTPQQVMDRMVSLSSKDVIGTELVGGTPNRVAFNGAGLTCNADNCLRSLRASHIEGRLTQSQEFCGELNAASTAEVPDIPSYAEEGCGGDAARIRSACLCLPVPTAAAL